MTNAIEWCKENRDAFYGALAFVFIHAGAPWNIIGAGIIGNMAAYAWAWRKYGRYRDRR